MDCFKACEKGDYDWVLDDKIGINYQDERGRTALHYAFSRSDIEVVKLLLAKGANHFIEDDNGWSALGFVSINWIMHPKSINDHFEIVKIILAGGGDIDQHDSSGYTLLHHASEYGYVKSVKLLLAKGANPDLQNNGGDTATHFASMRKHDQIIELLNRHKEIKEMEEWKPWNHSQFPLPYRHAMTTLVCLAKIF